MEKLWSPWRSQYIESFLKKKNDAGCVLCNSLRSADDEDSLVVEVGETTFTLMNLYPYNNGHLMIIPKRHIKNLEDLDEAESVEVMNKLKLMKKALTVVSNPDGFNIGANIGKVSGAGIDDHIHFHIVPRWNGDTNFMPVLGEVKVLSQDLLKTKSELNSALKKLK